MGALAEVGNRTGGGGRLGGLVAKMGWLWMGGRALRMSVEVALPPFPCPTSNGRRGTDGAVVVDILRAGALG